ncbi:hypothetical protein [Burkholderia glumae]|uniref:hypothetical protein n=1 Tax=Burkholderia glumae TaxID=337 RepID=UPI000F5FE2A4|nr:hypothetical protein [Burkholderia glumae]MCQ0029755.1 hypothetical protein [Burkholderia glumae]MCQ0038146.1 hypothetical protein [Burkholderia glumae]QJW77651.1 hypothetical protein GAS18_02010 [Burkholderia glumae]
MRIAHSSASVSTAPRPGAMRAEISRAGIRTPKRVKSKLSNSPTESSGAMWPWLPPCWRVGPARAVAQRAIDVVDQLLALGHVVVRMLAVAARAEVGLPDVAVGKM